MPLEIVSEDDLDKTLFAAQTTRAIAEAEARVDAAYGPGARMAPAGAGVPAGPTLRAEPPPPAKVAQARLHACWIVPVKQVDELPLPGVPRPVRRLPRSSAPCATTLPAPAFANFVTSTLADPLAAFSAPAMADPLAMLVAPARVDPRAILACMPGAQPGVAGAWTEPRSIPVWNDENACPLPTAVLHGYQVAGAAASPAPSGAAPSAPVLPPPAERVLPSEAADQLGEALPEADGDRERAWDDRDAREVLDLAVGRSGRDPETAVRPLPPPLCGAAEADGATLGAADGYAALECLSVEPEEVERECKRARMWADSSPWPVLPWQHDEALQSEP